MQERYERRRADLSAHGQLHVLRYWSELDAGQRSALLDDLEQVDLERCAPLIDTMVRGRPAVHVPERIEPPPAYPAVPTPELRSLYARADELGREAIGAGRVAALTVAGGQGTRLGYDGPKGMFPISPIRNASLFQWFAEFLVGMRRRYGRSPRWYIMTSPANDAATRAYFREKAYFGLPPEGVRFFVQRQMPAFLPDGRIAMSARHRIALSPDGHGGTLHALAASGSLREMAAEGIDTISYFQVDNPLVCPVDARFIGLHLAHGSEMSSKAVTKASDFERVGIFAQLDGRLGVLEYSDLPESLATARAPDGSRRFDAGSIAVHVLSRAFIERVSGTSGGALGWHRAEKKERVLDDRGEVITPDKPNVIKLEMFIFDAIPLASRPMVLFTERAEQFSPVKNAEGVDSPATSRRDLVRRAARWLEECGAPVARDPAGEPTFALEISPLYAIDRQELRERLSTSPPLRLDAPLLLA